MTEQGLKELLTVIAKDQLGIDTLERRRMDSLDFHDVSVWTVEAALQAAFELGTALATLNRPTLVTKRTAMAYLLRRERGASMEELCKATAWIEASVKRELARLCQLHGVARIPMIEVDGVWRYRLR